MDAAKAAEARGFVEKAVLEEVIKIAETPGDEAESGYAKESVEYLRVDFEPYSSGGVEVVAVFEAWGLVSGVAHILISATNQEEEEHSSPGDDVEAVYYYDKAERGDKKFAKSYEADI